MLSRLIRIDFRLPSALTIKAEVRSRLIVHRESRYAQINGIGFVVVIRAGAG